MVGLTRHRTPEKEEEVWTITIPDADLVKVDIDPNSREILNHAEFNIAEALGGPWMDNSCDMAGPECRGV